jgi:hypothetical protein
MQWPHTDTGKTRLMIITGLITLITAVLFWCVHTRISYGAIRCIPQLYIFLSCLNFILYTLLICPSVNLPYLISTHLMLAIGSSSQTRLQRPGSSPRKSACRLYSASKVTSQVSRILIGKKNSELLCLSIAQKFWVVG